MISLISNLWRVAEEGRFTERLLRQLTPRAVRNLKRPTVGDFLAAGTLHQSAKDALDRLLGNKWQQYENEFTELKYDIAERYKTSPSLPFPREGNLYDQAGLFMYVWVRNKRPRVILETGVANGHSTAILINALLRNGSGELHSIDIRLDAGAILTAEERKRWNFHILPAIGSRKAFTSITESIAPIDLFFHDSQHSYEWQMFEYRTALKYLSSGLLASDDADGNYAFLDFAKDIHAKADSLLDGVRLIGFTVINAATAYSSSRALGSANPLSSTGSP